MRRIVLIVPDLLGNPEDESALRQRLTALAALTEIGTLFKIASAPKIETPEALYLGLGPTEAQMRQGPLTVSALGADPPERSTHFHLSLMSHDDGRAEQPTYLPTADELALLWAAAKRLDTARFTLVRGEGFDHGLVWEALGDLGTTPARDVAGKIIKTALPEGDGDRPLRRLIDDSVNLLSELELNRQRVEEGLPPFNLLWPWGQGVREMVPNLLLRRGELATVESGSLRLAGLTRLSAYRHGSRAAFGKGLSTRLRDLADRALSRTISIVLVDAFAELRQSVSGEDDKMEEIHWLACEMDTNFFAPVLAAFRGERVIAEPMRFTLLAPSTSEAVGLGLEVRSDARQDNSLPFDERSLEERKLLTYDLASRVDWGVSL
jgi:hypothetical protein